MLHHTAGGHLTSKTLLAWSLVCVSITWCRIVHMNHTTLMAKKCMTFKLWANPGPNNSLSYADQRNDQQSITITTSWIITSINQCYIISKNNTLQLTSNNCYLLCGILGGQPILPYAISGWIRNFEFSPFFMEAIPTESPGIKPWQRWHTVGYPRNQVES